jgi:hypothetical protein
MLIQPAMQPYTILFNQTIDAQSTAGKTGCKSSKDIKVKCDLFREKNTTHHRTEEYVNNSLVLRRGDTFMLGIKFAGRNFLDILSVKLRFSMGEYTGGLKAFWASVECLDIEISLWEVLRYGVFASHDLFSQSE